MPAAGAPVDCAKRMPYLALLSEENGRKATFLPGRNPRGTRLVFRNIGLRRLL
jgi:hypothetical protein